MASLYLLGNPDHYTNKDFVVFYWKGYVTEVLKAWKQDGDARSDKVVLVKDVDGEYIGLSMVDDYIYRPYELSDKSLYEWIQISTRLKHTKAEQKKIQSQKHEVAKLLAIFKADEDVDTDFESDSDDLESDKLPEKVELHGKYAFLQNHPLHETHQVSISKYKVLVPNFAGGSLPRCDRGDREYYCTMMLTLFKPWRHGKNLKEDDQSWDEAFTNYKFTPRQTELMKFFNICYECNDARDDYSKLLKQKNTTDGVFPHWFSSDGNDGFDDDNYNNDGDFIVHEESEEDQYTSVGKKGLQRMEQMAEIQKIVTSAGWLDQCPDGPPSMDFARIEPEELPPLQWDAAVQEKRQQVLAERNKALPAQSGKQSGKDPNQNNVQIVDRSYLQKSFKAQSEAAQNLIQNVVEKFELTSEQERAFRIIANHAVAPGSEQLIMYVGGMAGTGKSQVIKALMDFFKSRNESHRFVVVAPTGTAAALLHGSTYHSFLGVPIDGQTALRNETTNNAQVKARLDGVEYIFLDEVSMVSCDDNYKISSQLAKALNEFGLPYGGINMIFLGDFAQLPPVFGSPLYSGTVGTQLMSRMTVQGQKAAIGKALWHQVTTVVILRKNMRQRTQTAEDAKLRTTLENMRYAACTTEDIKFLKTQIAGRCPGQPKLSDKEIRNVSIITALNAQKDRINELGSARFAAKTGQTLTPFYSIDRFGSRPDAAEK
jgi:PIF1-like helicase